jgi:hypothetical protein
MPVTKNKVNSYYSLSRRGPAAGKAVLTGERLRADMTPLIKFQNRAVINAGFGESVPQLNSFLQ